MKKQILYFVTGAFLSLSIVAFWAFKDKIEPSGKYAVVEFYPTGKSTIVLGYGSENIGEKNYQNKTSAQSVYQLLQEMDAMGYSLSQSQGKISGNEGGGSIFIFKKR